MRNYAPDPPATRPSAPPPRLEISHEYASRRDRRIKPVELSAWLEERVLPLTERWSREIRGRELNGGGLDGLLDEFLETIVRFLPAALGPHREQVEPVWTRVAELFGATAARRGLAAGEVIEEFQLLREAVIRFLYQDPPLAGRARLSLREVLRLNRAIDRGVTHASVGHTDALFFSLFEGSGIPDVPPDGELVQEVRQQLADMRREVAAVVGHLPGDRSGRDPS